MGCDSLDSVGQGRVGAVQAEFHWWAGAAAGQDSAVTRAREGRLDGWIYYPLTCLVQPRGSGVEAIIGFLNSYENRGLRYYNTRIGK